MSSNLDKDKTGSDKTRLEVIRTRREVTRTSHFPGGRTHSQDQESGRAGGKSNM